MASRRTILKAAVAAAAGVPVAGPAHAAGSIGRVVPWTLSRAAGPLGGSVRVNETSFPLSHLAIVWSGPGELAVRVRSVLCWNDWFAVHACHSGRDGAGSGQRSVLLTVPGAVGYEISSHGDVGEMFVTELNTVDGPVRAVPSASATTLNIGDPTVPIRYFNRDAWGADESLRFRGDGTEIWLPVCFPAQTLTLHHTAGANMDPDPAATVRAIYYFHAVTRGYGDVGYHLLIDEAGTVYEGRWSGVDPMPVFGVEPGPDDRPQIVNAAHAAGFNAGNLGVVLLGDFTTRSPTDPARRSLTMVLAELARLTNLDPLGMTSYVNPISGARKAIDTLSGHRDWLPTECPGNSLHPELPALRRAIARVLGAGDH